MAHQVELEFCGRTDQGLVREQNEDAIEIRAAEGMAVLADGMGGYRAGEIASQMATMICARRIEEDLDAFDWSTSANRGERLAGLILEAIHHANQSIFESAQREPEHAGMGTTLVATLFHHDKVLIAHVGDSRVYRMRDGLLVQLTHDHSRVQEQVDAGLISPEQARFATNRNLVTRALGIEPEVQVDLQECTTRPGDVYLLCSDGLTDMLDDADIAELLEWLYPTLDKAAEALVKRANLVGGLDNISVVLVRVNTTSPEHPGLFERMREWVR